MFLYVQILRQHVICMVTVCAKCMYPLHTYIQAACDDKTTSLTWLYLPEGHVRLAVTESAVVVAVDDCRPDAAHRDAVEQFLGRLASALLPHPDILELAGTWRHHVHFHCRIDLAHAVTNECFPGEFMLNVITTSQSLKTTNASHPRRHGLLSTSVPQADKPIKKLDFLVALLSNEWLRARFSKA